MPQFKSVLTEDEVIDVANEYIKRSPSALQIADEIVNGERGSDYGHPWYNFTDTANMWSVIVGMPITPEQVAMMMICLKICRELHKPKDDNVIDMAGYVATLEKVKNWRKETNADDDKATKS